MAALDKLRTSAASALDASAPQRKLEQLRLDAIKSLRERLLGRGPRLL